MLPFAEYIDTLKYSQLAAWFVLAFTFILFFPYAKKAAGFILVKLYELFISSRGHITPD
jgi:hypothetical protein